MATYTGFCFGTGEKSTMKKKNIISQFSEATIPLEDRFVREGPGMLGKEVTPNAIQSVIEVEAWLLRQQDDKNTLNLTGFSRGSVTCIEIANRLKHRELALAKKGPLTHDESKVLERLQKLEINIFAMDPVAGMSDKGVMVRRVIPDNVKNYVAVLQTDEMRRDFKPQDMTRVIIDSPNTNVSMLPMYGNHSDTTKIKKDSMQSGAKIMWHSLYQFLTQHGTQIQGGMPKMVTSDPKKVANPYSDITPFPPETQGKEMLKLFNRHHQEREAYLNSGKTVKILDGIPILRDVRSLNNNLNFYVKNSDFFVNQLERELFKVSYPKVFNYLFEQNQKDPHFPDSSASSKEEVMKALKKLKEEDQDLFARLNKLAVGLDEHQEPTFGEPGGGQYIEPCSTVRQMFPCMLPESAKILNPDIAKLAALERSVNRLTFKYEREKTELLAFSQRNQADKAQELRNEVRGIIENDPGTAAEKYEKILNAVEAHYKHLTQSASASEFPLMLGGLLTAHDRHFQVKETSASRIVMAEFVHATLSLLRETVDFVFSVGYLGGGVFSVVGTTLQDFGRRCNDVIGKVGMNPLKGLASAIAYGFEGIGFAIKNSLGLKTLGNVITSAIRDIRDEIVKAIGPIKVDPVEKCKQIKQSLQSIQEKGTTKEGPDMGNGAVFC